MQFKPERQHCDSCDSHDQYEFEVTFPGLGVFREVRFRPDVTFRDCAPGRKSIIYIVCLFEMMLIRERMMGCLKSVILG